MLGDILCSPSEMQAGVNAIGQLITYWQSVGSPTKYAAAVQAIVARGKAATDQLSLSTSLVGNCQVKDAGLQAQALMAQIASDTGRAAPTAILSVGPSESIGMVGDILKWGLLLGAGYLAYSFLSKKGR